MPHATSTCVDEMEGYLEGMRISTSAWRRRPASERSGELDRQNLRCPYFTATSGTHPDDLALEPLRPARFVSDGPIGTMGRG